MALYFATVQATGGQSLQAALVAHYDSIPAGSSPIPGLISPTTIMVSWISLSSPDPVHIIGTSSTIPYYAPAIPLPVEFPGGGGRNTIALNSIFFDISATIILAFQII